MKITGVSAQQKNSNRINIMVDGVYRFSLDIFQYADLGIKVGKDYTEEELTALETESQFGKVYTRTLEYCLSRPHSAKEVRDYLYRKTRDMKVKTRTGEVRDRPGIPAAVTQRVFDRLVEKRYINDEKFARFWVENRNLRKGVSQRKLRAELQAKGVASGVIDEALSDSLRSDDEEIMKIIAKKRARYTDEQKLIQYLARQGFGFDEIKSALQREEGDR